MTDIENVNMEEIVAAAKKLSLNELYDAFRNASTGPQHILLTTSMLKKYIAAGNDISTGLISAIHDDRIELVMIFALADLLIETNTDYNPALIEAARLGRRESLRWIIGCIEVLRQNKDININYQDAMRIAVVNGHAECVKELIYAGADVNELDYIGWTPVISAVHYGHIDCLRLLISAGADLNIQEFDGWTALMYASKYGYIDSIMELVSAGADINIRDNSESEWSAFELILRNKHYDAAELLIEAGADIYAKDKYGKAAIDYCKNKRVKARLIKLANRHITAAIKCSESPEIIKGFDAEK